MIRKIHLVFKTHLDVGFTDYAHKVVENYFTRFIPKALDTAEELRRSGGPERFVWTTGSWLIYEYLEQAGQAERTRLERAIVAGDITWHGLPFTLHSELLDPELFRFGLSLSADAGPALRSPYHRGQDDGRARPYPWDCAPAG